MFSSSTKHMIIIISMTSFRYIGYVSSNRQQLSTAAAAGGSRVQQQQQRNTNKYRRSTRYLVWAKVHHTCSKGCLSPSSAIACIAPLCAFPPPSLTLSLLLSSLSFSLYYLVCSFVRVHSSSSSHRIRRRAWTPSSTT